MFIYISRLNEVYQIIFFTKWLFILKIQYINQQIVDHTHIFTW